MQWAADHDHIVLTNDLDFGAILASTQKRRPSVLQLRSDILTPTAIGPVVVAAIRHSDQELRNGALISIDAVRARMRILPLNG
jgi:predicted nuclease of predicted toxin-antitoxin system